MNKAEYTIIATLGDDLERIVEANFLDDDELLKVEEIIIPLFDKCDLCWANLDAMTEEEKYQYELLGGKMFFPYPYFVFDNKKHRNLLCYIELANIGIKLPLNEIPDVFERSDVINLLS